MSRYRIGSRVAGALTTIVLLGVASGASAQPWGYGYAPPPQPYYGYQTPYTRTPGLDRRQAMQRDWLREGVASGRITPREADRIRRGIWELERHERAAKADGYISPAERQQLREHARHVDALISRNWYDHQVRPRLYGELWR